jgi:prophage maintenance system killer protein
MDAQRVLWRGRRRDLAKVCVSFDGGIERLWKQHAGVLEQTGVAGAMYAGILRLHPFADGSRRTSFVALSAALWSLGLLAVEFAQDADMTDHDDAVASGLFSPDGDIEPFAQLLATRIEHARRRQRQHGPSGARYSSGSRSMLLLSVSKRRVNRCPPPAVGINARFAHSQVSPIIPGAGRTAGRTEAGLLAQRIRLRCAIMPRRCSVIEAARAVAPDVDHVDASCRMSTVKIAATQARC